MLLHPLLKNLSQVVEHLKELGRDGEDGAEDPDKKNNIVFNATSEFCRTLGDIPTYGLSGNREDQEDIMVMLDKICSQIWCEMKMKKSVR